MPAPPMANLPRWAMWKSVAKPSSAEYMHMGGITMRFGRVMPRSWIGWNSSGVDAVILSSLFGKG